MKFASCLAAVVLLPGLLVAQDPPTKQEKLDELLQTVQNKMELDDSLRGVYLAGGTFKPNMGMPGEVLHLSGKLMNPAQAETVKQLVLDAMKEDSYWKKDEGPLTIATDQMLVSLGSPQMANQLYDLALTSFWKNDYETANKAFSKAMAEAPNDDVIRYWSAVNALAQGQKERAEAKLRSLMETQTQGSRTPVIATALERVQGPLRRQLMEMEKELLLSL